MAAAVTRSPEADAGRIDPGHGLSEADRIAIATSLQDGIRFLPGPAITGTEIGVIVDQHTEAGRGENLRVAVKVLLLHRGQAVRHDNAGTAPCFALWRVEPAA